MIDTCTKGETTQHIENSAGHFDFSIKVKVNENQDHDHCIETRNPGFA